MLSMVRLNYQSRGLLHGRFKTSEVESSLQLPRTLRRAVYSRHG
jgi:hypothetical protein